MAKRRPDVTVPGEVVDTAGAVIGEHKGLVHHTVGQRRGLGIARQDPLFVIRLEPATNRVVAGTREEAAARNIAVDAVSVISGDWPEAAFSAEAMVRYRGAPVSATIEPGPASSRELTVRFAGAGPVASPGQALVLYRGEEVLGGGTIRAVTTSSPA